MHEGTFITTYSPFFIDVQVHTCTCKTFFFHLDFGIKSGKQLDDYGRYMYILLFSYVYHPDVCYESCTCTCMYTGSFVFYMYMYMYDDPLKRGASDSVQRIHSTITDMHIP